MNYDIKQSLEDARRASRLGPSRHDQISGGSEYAPACGDGLFVAYAVVNESERLGSGGKDGGDGGGESVVGCRTVVDHMRRTGEFAVLGVLRRSGRYEGIEARDCAPFHPC